MKRNSYAKVNLDLRVIGKRKDGYHDLDMIVCPISLCDELTIERLDSDVELFTIEDSSLKMDEDNLVIKALRRFQDIVETSGGIKIHLLKRIPVEAGLGGGSSNAATTLLMLNELYEFPLNDAQLHQIASELGADVPFFLKPQLAVVQGKGERVRYIKNDQLHHHFITVFKPTVGCSTPLVFQQVKSYSFPVSSALVELLDQGQMDVFFASIHNDLFLPACLAYPMIEDIEADLALQYDAPLVMSGSGSALILYQQLSDEEINDIKADILSISDVFSAQLLTYID